MSALAAPMIAPKTTDWLPVSTPRELGIGDVVVIRKKVHPCVEGSETHGIWSRKRYQQSKRKPVEVQISGRIVRSYVETEGFHRGLIHILEPTALSMPTPGQAVPAGIRIQLHDEIKLHPRFYEGYRIRRSARLSPDPSADLKERHAFMANLLRVACNDDVDRLAECVDPWGFPCVRLGRNSAVNMLRLKEGWQQIREFHIRQCDGRMKQPRPWGETWSPPPKKIEHSDHSDIPY